MTASPLLQMTGIEKTFPGVRALAGVDLALRAGEVLALVGENGAGKSTLMKVLGGAHEPDAGTVRIGGSPVRIHNPHVSRRMGISLTHQEVEHLFVIIRDLKANGIGVIYVSHRLDEVFRIADRVMVLHEGRIKGEITNVASASQEDVLAMAMT